MYAVFHARGSSRPKQAMLMLEALIFGSDNVDIDNTKDYSYCPHYTRSSCLLHFRCCDQGTFFPCHKCHNEFIEKQTAPQELECDNEMEEKTPAQQCGEDEIEEKTPPQECGEDEMEDSSEDEKRCHPQATCLDAHLMQCTNCSCTTDEFAPKCKDCNTSFASYFCEKCKLFVNSKNLDPYHCDGCGICRVHKSNNFHCAKCNICLHKKMKNNHKCLENSGHDMCAVCMEGVFSGCIVLPCSHKLHKSCLEGLIQHGRLDCPNCRQSFVPKSENNKGSFSIRACFSRLLNCTYSRQSTSTQTHNI